MEGSAVKDDARSLPTVLVVRKPVQLHGSRKCRAELHDDGEQRVTHVVLNVEIVRVFMPPEVNL